MPIGDPTETFLSTPYIHERYLYSCPQEVNIELWVACKAIFKKMLCCAPTNQFQNGFFFRSDKIFKTYFTLNIS